MLWGRVTGGTRCISIYRRLQGLGLHAVRHVWTPGLPRANLVRVAVWGGVDCSLEIFDI